MDVLYKTFKQARTVFWALSVYFLAVFPLHAQESIFTVEDVLVDVSAENAIKARDLAFEKAQVEAFSTLSARMVEASGGSSPAIPASSTISTLIQDYEVTKEQLSAVRYVGTYTFRFRESAVRKYFGGQGVRYSDVSSQPVLILPYYERDGEHLLWSPYNEWAQAWNRTGTLSGLVPVIVPLGDVEDVQDLRGGGDAFDYQDRHLRAMLSRYDAGEAVIAVAVPDRALARSGQGGEALSGVLSVNIYRTDRARAEFVTQVVETARATESRAQLFDRAVKRVHQALQKDWKKKTSVSAAAQSSSLQARVGFKTLAEWNKAKRTLKYVQGIDRIVVKSLTPSNAQIDIMFQGTEERLRLALQQVGITLSGGSKSARGPGQTQGLSGIGGRAVSGIYDRYGNAGRPAANNDIVYDLYLNRYAPGAGRY